MSHTPGPWRVAVDSYGGFNRIWSQDGIDVACCEGDGSIPRDERNKNELLIAAAPDLLEALESCLGCLELECDTCEGCSVNPCSQCQAKAAIRKAKGGL